MNGDTNIFIGEHEDCIDNVELVDFSNPKIDKIIVAGLCRTGTLTSNNIQALKDLALQIPKDQQKEFIVMPIPGISVAKYILNMTKGLDNIFTQNLANSILSILEPNASINNLKGAGTLERCADDIAVDPCEFVNVISPYLDLLGEDVKDGFLANISGQDGMVFLSDAFCRLDNTIANCSLQREGIENVAVYNISPSETNEVLQSQAKVRQDLDRKNVNILTRLISQDGGLAMGPRFFTDYVWNWSNANNKQNPDKLRQGLVETIKSRFSILAQKPRANADRAGYANFEQVNESIIWSSFEETIGNDSTKALLNVDTWNWRNKEVRQLGYEFMVGIILQLKTPFETLKDIDSAYTRPYTARDQYGMMIGRVGDESDVAILRQNFEGTSREDDPFIHAVSDSGAENIKVIRQKPQNEAYWSLYRDLSPVFIMAKEI